MKMFGTFTATEAPFAISVRSFQNELLHVQPSTMDAVIAALGPHIYPSQPHWQTPRVIKHRFRGYSYEFGDPLVTKVMKIVLELEGRRPKPWQLTLTPYSDGYYFENLRREYTATDLDKAHYLALFGTMWLAKMAPRKDFGPLKVIGNKMLEKPKAFGRLDPYVVRGMNTSLVEELKKRDLKGFTVREIEVLNRKPQHQSIWEPWSTVTMPRCCLPLVNSWGEPCGPDLMNNRGCHYECGPYMPEEKVFLRSEVEALGSFDIAVCQEYVGMGNNDRFPSLVVSQRFRQTLKELKVPGVAFAPVWLVEEGTPLWKNPWEEILGPYPEPVPVAQSMQQN